MIHFEKEIVEYLNLPSLPKKIWDGRRSFKHGVIVTTLYGERKAYAVATFDANKDAKPRVTHVFCGEPFVDADYEHIAVVPDYMNTEGVEDWDIDEQSKRMAAVLIEEARELENEGTIEPRELENEWVLPEIHSREEAEAYIREYLRTHRQARMEMPETDDEIKAILIAISASSDSNTKRKNKRYK